MFVKHSILLITIMLLCLISCRNYNNPNFIAPSGIYKCIEAIDENYNIVEPYKDEKEVLLEGNKVTMGDSIGYLLPKGEVKIVTYYPLGYMMNWFYERGIFTIQIIKLGLFDYEHYRRLKYELKY